jgi:hypothetical protein
MQWWAWLIIWVVLVLALIGTVVLLGYRLFRKAMGAYEELAVLSDKVARLMENVERLEPDEPERAIAVGYPEVSRRHDARKARRERAKEARREARLARGRLLVSPESIEHLRKWADNVR